jgi:hypothetical protein
MQLYRMNDLLRTSRQLQSLGSSYLPPSGPAYPDRASGPQPVGAVLALAVVAKQLGIEALNPAALNLARGMPEGLAENWLRWEFRISGDKLPVWCRPF